MKKQDLFSNYLYQFFYQVLIFVIPLILSPYLARTLQEKALGTYIYVNSIAYFFVVAANLGIELHGKRIVAKNADDKDNLSRTFWSLFVLHISISLAVLLAYVLFISLLGNSYEDKTVYLIETLYVLSALFDITWLFYGLENISDVIIKNALVKIVECIMIFLLVKEPSDLGKYVWISAGGVLVGQVIMLPDAIRLVGPIRFTVADVRQHIKPIFSLAVAVFCVTIYTVMDKTMLGLMSTRENVAYYDYSYKVILVPLMCVSVLEKVMLPQACRLVAREKEKEQKTYMRFSFLLTTCISMGAMYGLLSVSGLFARVYYGPKFATCGDIIAVMAPLVYIIGIGGVLRSQYIIPRGMDKQYNICLLLNALLNLTLNVLLIPVLSIYGAVIGSLAAELFGLCYQMIICRRAIPLTILFETFLPFCGIGALMFVAVRALSCFLPQTVAGLLIEIAIGLVLYMTMSCLYIGRHCPELVDKMLDKLPFRN